MTNFPQMCAYLVVMEEVGIVEGLCVLAQVCETAKAGNRSDYVAVVL